MDNTNDLTEELNQYKEEWLKELQMEIEIKELFYNYPLENNENFYIVSQGLARILGQLPDKPVKSAFIRDLLEEGEKALEEYDLYS